MSTATTDAKSSELNSQVLIFSSDTVADTNRYALMGEKAHGGMVSLEELKGNIQTMAPAIDGVVETLKQNAKAKGLGEVTLSLGINAKGKVGFLGTGAEVGGTATITLKYLIK